MNSNIQDIIKIAFENGINMFDTAEAYAKGQSEIDMSVLPVAVALLLY